MELSLAAAIFIPIRKKTVLYVVQWCARTRLILKCSNAWVLFGRRMFLRYHFPVIFQEVEQHQHLTKLQDEEMKRRHEIERKRLPKIQRNEIKVKAQNYRKILRDKKVSLEQEKDLMREVHTTKLLTIWGGGKGVVITRMHTISLDFFLNSRYYWGTMEEMVVADKKWSHFDFELKGARWGSP